MSPTIALVMMVKDEKSEILRSLNSVIDHETKKACVDHVVILHTGSEKQTFDSIQHWCKEYDIPLTFQYAEFVDFSTSRNQLLDMADNVADYLIQLDANDEVENPSILRNMVNQDDSTHTAFLITQRWESSYRGIQTFCNKRILRSKSFWRYSPYHKLHEYIVNLSDDDKLEQALQDRCKGIDTHLPRACHSVGDWTNQIVIRQCRDGTQGRDGDYEVLSESIRSIESYVQKLEKESNENLDDKTVQQQQQQDIIHSAWKIRIASAKRHLGRDTYYLAETNYYDDHWREAFHLYARVAEEPDFANDEVKFCAAYKAAVCLENEGSDWSQTLTWFLKAFHLSQMAFGTGRAEPLTHVARHYCLANEYATAYMFAKQACDLPFPVDAMQFVEKDVYDYNRWFFLGRAAWYVDQMEVGRHACLKALQSSPHCKKVKRNLEFYLRTSSLHETHEANKILRKSIAYIIGHAQDDGSKYRQMGFERIMYFPCTNTSQLSELELRRCLSLRALADMKSNSSSIDVGRILTYSRIAKAFKTETTTTTTISSDLCFCIEVDAKSTKVWDDRGATFVSQLPSPDTFDLAILQAHESESPKSHWSCIQSGSIKFKSKLGGYILTKRGAVAMYDILKDMIEGNLEEIIAWALQRDEIVVYAPSEDLIQI